MIQLNISHLFTQSRMIKQFYLRQFNLTTVICLLSVNRQTVLFDPEIGLYQLLPPRAWLN